MSPNVLQKKKAVIRDWFKLVVWYIRLRRAAKSTQTIDFESNYTKYKIGSKPNDPCSKFYISHQLLKVERRIQESKKKLLKGDGRGIQVVREAKVAQYKEMKMKGRKMAREYDSDDGANGYDSTSSDEAELLI